MINERGTCTRCNHHESAQHPQNGTCSDAGAQGSKTPRCGCPCQLFDQLAKILAP